MELTRVDIIGNGASNTLYTPSDRYVICCNIPQHGYNYNALSIIDAKVVYWMRSNKWHPRVPVYTTQETKELRLKQNIEGDWFPIYNKTNHWNAGLHAANYMAKPQGEIHLWGFDSMWSKDCTSQMDTLVPRAHRPPLHQRWWPIWNEIFDRHTNTQFVIHTPQGVEHAFSKPNVRQSQENTEMA